MADYSRQMLHSIRQNERRNLHAYANLFEAKDPNQPTTKPFIIKANDVQFGSVRESQINNLRKTIGDVSFKENALKYYKDLHDLVIEGEISALELKFQFRYKDPSGDGCYIWCEGYQMTDANLRTIQKIRDAFLNWKDSLVEDADLLEKVDKEASKG